MGLTSRYRALIDDPYGRTSPSACAEASTLTMDSGFHSTDTTPPPAQPQLCSDYSSMTSSQISPQSPAQSTNELPANQIEPRNELVFRFDEDHSAEKARQGNQMREEDLDMSLVNREPRLDFPAAFVTGFEDGGINFEIPGVATDRFSPPDGLTVGFKAHKFGEVTGEDVDILASAADALTRFRSSQQSQETNKHQNWASTSSCRVYTPSHSFAARCQYLVDNYGSYSRFDE